MPVTLTIPSETLPLLRHAVERELNILKISIKNTEGRLKRFEKKYDMDSKQFYERFSAGEMGDDHETMLWAAEYEAFQHIKKELRKLRKVLQS